MSERLGLGIGASVLAVALVARPAASRWAGRVELDLLGCGSWPLSS